MSNLEFDRIYLNQSVSPGRLRIIDSGLGWKAKDKKPFLLASNALISANWSRASKGYELRIQTRDNKVIMFDGFDNDNFNQLKNDLKRKFNIELEQKDHILRGWNWGTTTLARSELIFNINQKPDFELPYEQISNTNLTGRNEVAIEFKPDVEGEKQGDELVEMRFYVPGMVSNKKAKKDDGENGEEDNNEEPEEEDQTAATHFYEQLKDKASLGQVAGEAIVSFSDVFFLTPRGRYDVDIYSSSLRLRGKTYDNKVQFRAIERIFSLPKPDDVHHLVIIQVDPPLTQGQTRYSFLTMQFPREELMDVEINLSDEEYKAKYKDKIKRSYSDEKTHTVIAQCFKGLTDRKITVPSLFRSKHGQVAVSCSLKANEGYLYFLEKSLLFVIKPTVYLPFSEISAVQMSRVGNQSSSKTFDLEVKLRTGTSHVFGNIARDEQKFIENYLVDRGVRVKNEEEEGKKILSSALGDDADDSDASVMRGSAGDDDDSSEDEDFNEEDASDDDVAEEYDSDAGSNSDSDGGEKPAKKKAKK